MGYPDVKWTPPEDAVPVKQAWTPPVDAVPIQKKKKLANVSQNGLPPSNGGFNPFPASQSQPFSAVAATPQMQQQLQAQGQQQVQQDNAKQQAQSDALKPYWDSLSPDEQKALDQGSRQVIAQHDNQSLTATSQQEQGDYAYSQTLPGKIQNAVTYLAQKATKGGLQVAKGAAYLYNLGANAQMGKLSGDSKQTDEVFKSADEATNFLPKGSEARVEDSNVMKNLGGLAEFLPAAAAASSTGGATLYLQGLGQGKETMDNAEANGAKINPTVKTAFILGSGAVNGFLMGDLGHGIFNSLGSSLKDDVVKNITMNAIKEAAGKDITAEGFTSLLQQGAKDWGDKALQGGVNFLKSTKKSVTDLSLLNIGNFALKKGVDATNDTPVFPNENLGTLAQQEGETLKSAPLFGLAGSVGDVSKLTPFSEYKNAVVDNLLHDSSDANVANTKQFVSQHGAEQGWSPDEIQATNNHIDDLAGITKSIPKNLPPEKGSQAVDLIIGRNTLQKELQQAQTERQGLTAPFNAEPSQGETLLQDKIDQANDKLRALVSGNRPTYSKGTEANGEDGTFFKTTSGVKEEIPQSRYDLEVMERDAKVKQQADELGDKIGLTPENVANDIISKSNEAIQANQAPAEVPVETPKEDATGGTGNPDQTIDEGSGGFKGKSDVELEKRMGELENAKSFTPERDEYNQIEKEMEKRERSSVFDVPLDRATNAIDNLIKKNKEMPNGYGAFIEPRDARESKAIIERYTTDKNNLSDNDIKNDFKQALLGNPDTWYADGLKLRESANLAAERGIDINDLLKNVQDEFTKDGYDANTAKDVIAMRLARVIKSDKATDENGGDKTVAEAKTAIGRQPAGDHGLSSIADDKFEQVLKNVAKAEGRGSTDTGRSMLFKIQTTALSLAEERDLEKNDPEYAKLMKADENGTIDEAGTKRMKDIYQQETLKKQIRTLKAEYEKAKASGDKPAFVKAVEDILKPEQKENSQIKQQSNESKNDGSQKGEKGDGEKVNAKGGDEETQPVQEKGNVGKAGNVKAEPGYLETQKAIKDKAKELAHKDDATNKKLKEQKADILDQMQEVRTALNGEKDSDALDKVEKAGYEVDRETNQIVFHVKDDGIFRIGSDWLLDDSAEKKVKSEFPTDIGKQKYYSPNWDNKTGKIRESELPSQKAGRPGNASFGEYKKDLTDARDNLETATKAGNKKMADFWKSEVDRIEKLNLDYTGKENRGIFNANNVTDEDISKVDPILKEDHNITTKNIVDYEREQKPSETKPLSETVQRPTNDTAGNDGENKQSKTAQGKAQADNEPTTTTTERGTDGNTTAGSDGERTGGISNKAKELADKIRSLKSDKNVLHGGLEGVATAVWDGALETVATVIEKGGELADAINEGVKHILNAHPDLDKDEVRKKLDDDINGVSEKPKEEPIGENGDVKKTILTKRAYEGDIQPDVKKYLEDKGLTRTSFSQEERSKQATDFINKFGEEAAIHAVDTNDIKGGMAASVLAQLQVRLARAMSDLPEGSDERDAMAKKYADLIDMAEQKGYWSGEYAGQLAYEYQNAELNYAGVKKQVEKLTGKSLTPEQDKKVKEITDQNEKLKQQLKDAEAKLIDATDKALNEPDKPAPKEKPKTEYAKKALDAVVKVRAKIRENNYSDATGMVALVDSGLATIEAAIRTGMSVTKAIEKGIEHIKGELQKRGIGNWEKEDDFRKDVTDAFAENGVTDTKKERDENYLQQSNIKRLEKELDALKQNRLKEAPTKREFSDQENALKEQIKQEKLRIGLENMQSAFLDKKDNKFTPQQARDIWGYMKGQYLDNGVAYKDALSKTARDLGISWRQAAEAITTPKLKPVRDAVWNRQAALARNKSAIKNWVDDQNRNAAWKAWRKVSGVVRAEKVFGHSGIFVGTHAALTLFDPRTMNLTVRAFINGWKFAYKGAFSGNHAAYEQAMEELKNRPTYLIAQRAGLKNNPDRVNAEEFQRDQNFLGKVGLSGIRGFNAIKVLRQDLFDYEYNKRSAAELDEPGVPQGIAHLMNLGTGATNVNIHPAINEVTFAAGMEMARWEKLFASPAKATSTALKAIFTPDKATTSEKVFAKVWAQRAGAEVATLTTVLLASAALQNTLYPKNKVNLFDPDKPDWLKIKFGNLTIDATGGMRSLVQFIYKLGEIPFENANKLKGESVISASGEKIANYARGKLAPVYSTLADQYAGADFEGNVLPYRNKKPASYAHKLTWEEYAWKQAPLPVAEAATTFYQSALEHGAHKKTLDNILKGIRTGFISGVTGFRAGEYDANAQENKKKK